MSHGHLGEFEYLLLLALLRLGDGAYGVPLRDEIERRSGRRPSLGNLYTALERLERKGYVRSRMGEPTPVRGGRRKKECRLTTAGERALSRTWEAHLRMTEGLEERLEGLREIGRGSEGA